MDDQRQIKIPITGDASDIKQTFEDVKGAARDMAQSVQQAGQQAGQGLSGIGDGAAPALQKVDAATRSMTESVKRMAPAARDAAQATDQFNAAQSRYLASLERQAIIASQGKAAYLELKASQLGVSEAARASLAAIRAAEAGVHGLGGSTALTTQQMQGLIHSARGVTDMMLAGQSPMRAFAIEAGRLSGTFGGAGKAFDAVLSLLTPMRVGMLAAAAGVAALSLELVHAEKSLREISTLQAQLAGSGRSGMFSNDSLKSYINELAQAQGVTRETATAIVSELSKAHNIGGALFKDLGKLANDYARATGTTVPAAAAALAKAFSDPAQGAKELDKALGSLTSTQILAIERMVRQGDQLGAQKALYDALAGKIKGLADNGVTPLQKATNDLGNAWERAMQQMDRSDALQNMNKLLAASVGWVKDLVQAAGNLSTTKPPAWLYLIPGGGLPLALLSGNQKSAIPAGGGDFGGHGASGSFGPGSASSATAGAPSDDFIKRQLEVANGYQSEAGRISDLTEKRKALNKALADSNKLYGANSEQSKHLREGLAGIAEEMKNLAKKGSGKDEYEALIKRVKERLAQQQQEIAGGRALTEQEKFDIKTRTDLTELMAKYPKLSKEVVAGMLAESDARQRTIEQQKLWVTAAKEVNKFLLDQDAELAADAKARTDERDKVYAGIAEQRRALEENAQLQQAEFSMVGATATARQTAVEQLRIELQLKREIDKINENLKLNEEQRGEAIKRATENATEAKSQAAQRAVLDEWKRTSDSINQSLTDALLRGFESGKDFAQNFRDTLKNMFETLILRPTIQAIVEKPANAIGQAVSGGGSSGYASGGIMNNMGLIGAGYQALTGASVGASGASLAYANGVGALGGDSIGALIAGNGGWAGVGAGTAGLGYGVGAAGAGAAGALGGAGAATGADLAIAYGGAEAAGGAAAAAGGTAAAGAGTAALAAIPVAGWIALGAIALYSIFSKKGGGPKTEGYFNPYNSDRYYSSNSADVMNAARTEVQTIQGQYDSLVSTYGGAGGLQFGLGYSTDPRGKAPSQVHVGIGQNGTTLANLTNTNVGRSQEDLQAAIGLETQRAILYGLQHSGLRGKIGEYLSSLGDIASITADKVTEAIARIQKAATEKQGLEEKLFALTHTALEQSAAARAKERAAIDESNQALYDHVAALTDLTNTLATQRDQLTQAYQSESTQLQEVISRNTQYAQQLRAVRDGLSSQDATLTLSQKRALAGSAFRTTLSSAIGGDENAIQNLGSTGQALIDAVKASARTPQEVAAAVAQVQAGLTTAASSAEGRASVAQQQLDAMTQQLSALGLINTTVLTVGQALAAYLATQTAIQQENLNYTAQLAQQTAASAPTPVAPSAASVASSQPSVLSFDQWLSKYGSSVDSHGSWEDLPDYQKAAYRSYLSMVGAPAYASGGLASGRSLVGENGPELVDFQTPGRVYTSEQTKGMFANNAAFAPLLSEVSKKLDVVVDSIRTGDVAVLQQLSTVARTLKKFDTIGMPATRA